MNEFAVSRISSLRMDDSAWPAFEGLTPEARAVQLEAARLVREDLGAPSYGNTDGDLE